MSSKPLFDLEGKIREALKPKNSLGLETTGKDIGVPNVKTAEPAKVAPSKVEQAPPTEQSNAQPQTTTPLKIDLMVEGSPKKKTRNAERFLR